MRYFIRTLLLALCVGAGLPAHAQGRRPGGSSVSGRPLRRLRVQCSFVRWRTLPLCSTLRSKGAVFARFLL
jgi:hypothetical protein